MQLSETATLTETQNQDIWRLLIAGDNEFVPPLSARASTSQANLSSLTIQENAAGPIAYFEQLQKQCFILASENGHVRGFLSYIENKSLDSLIPNCTASATYVSTILVDKAYRRQGITSKMYERLFVLYPNCPIATRTWSTNHSHIAILEKNAFHIIHRIPDDRGSGIDTVYYMRNL